MQTQPARQPAPAIGRASLGLFMGLSCLYLALARGHTTSVDEGHVLETTEALAERGAWGMRERLNGREFSRYSVWPSLLGVPFYLAAEPLAASRAAPGGSAAGSAGLTRGQILAAAVTLETPFITAATAAILLAGLCRLGLPTGAALMAALVGALGTLAFPYSGTLYVQPLAALALAWLVTRTLLGDSVGSAAALAFLLSLRPDFLVLLPALAIDALVSAARPSRAWRHTAWLALGAVVGVGFAAWVNSRRGDPFFWGSYADEAFTTPVWIGLYGLLLSPGKGLVWFAPAAAAGLVLLPWLVRRAPRAGRLLALLTATILVVVSCWWTWHGAWSWGPRLLVPAMPLLALPWAWVFADWRERPAALRLTVAGLLAASLAVQLCGVLSNPIGERLFGGAIAGNENEWIYVPQTGPWASASIDFPDLLAVRLWRLEPGWRPAVVALLGALATGVAGGFALAVRSLRLPRGAVRGLLPVLPAWQLAMASALVLTCALPSAAERVLIGSAPAVAAASPGGTLVPDPYARLAADAHGDRIGTLYAPLGGDASQGGDYVLYAVGPFRTVFLLDDVPLFGGGEAPRAQAVRLRPGFHRLVVRGQGGEGLDKLYWTIPGNAQFKEPIPSVYVAEPIPSWRARAAIQLRHMRWAIWLAAGLVAILVFARQGATAGNRISN